MTEIDTQALDLGPMYSVGRLLLSFDGVDVGLPSRNLDTLYPRLSPA